MKLYDIVMCFVGAFALRLWISDITLYLLSCVALGVILGINRGSQN